MDKIGIIGDLINNAYGRARNAWKAKNLEGYQHLAKLQTELGSDYLDVNIDNTNKLSVKKEEMLAFLPDLIPALQEASTAPLCFDNPSYEFHKTALEAYDFSKSSPPIINSIAASREKLDDTIALIGEYNASVIVIASEKLTANGSEPCYSANEIYLSARKFVEKLKTQTNIQNNQIFIDPGLPPIGADTRGLVNMGLDAIQLIRADKDLEGVHISVGLSNFAWGTPKHLRATLERCYLSIAGELGLDFSISNPEHNPSPLPLDNDFVLGIKDALQQGRPMDGESMSEAGFRQASAILALVTEEEEEEDW